MGRSGERYRPIISFSGFGEEYRSASVTLSGCSNEKYHSRIGDGIKDWELSVGGFWDGAASELYEVIYNATSAVRVEPDLSVPEIYTIQHLIEKLKSVIHDQSQKRHLIQQIRNSLDELER